jgi:uncharacterized protein (TIGR03086 family)
VVDRVRAEQLGDATPCVDWTVREVIDHVVTGNLLFAAMATGRPQPDRAADHVGDDPSGALAASLGALEKAFTREGFLGETHPNPFGEGPGALLVDMRRTELTVHSWDIARASGQSTDFDDALVAAVRASVEAAPMLADRSGTPFDEIKPAPPGATAADRLAAYLGRDV